MSIETEINRISTNVSNTLSAVSEMGGEVPEGATSDDMASGVRSIPVGAKIDDTTPSTSTTYSSQKIEAVVTELNQANAAQDEVIAAKANDADLAKVAKSGSYSDLTGKPTIPTVPSTLPNPNKLKLTGAVTAEYDGSSEVIVEIPAGSSEYTLPIANETTLGGVMPVAKTDEMTQAVGVDAEGKLFTAAGSGGGGETLTAASTETVIASGTFAAGVGGPFTELETGVTLRELRKWKIWAYSIISTETNYYRVVINGNRLAHTQGARPIGFYSWLDTEKKFVYTLGTTGADGWVTKIDDNLMKNNVSFLAYSGSKTWLDDVTDDTPVKLNFNSATTVEVAWKIVGILKYGG